MPEKQKKLKKTATQEVVAQLEDEYQIFHRQVVKVLEDYQQVVNKVLKEIESKKLEEVRKKINKI